MLSSKCSASGMYITFDIVQRIFSTAYMWQSLKGKGMTEKRELYATADYTKANLQSNNPPSSEWGEAP